MSVNEISNNLKKYVDYYVETLFGNDVTIEKEILDEYPLLYKEYIYELYENGNVSNLNAMEVSGLPNFFRDYVLYRIMEVANSSSNSESDSGSGSGSGSFGN